MIATRILDPTYLYVYVYTNNEPFLFSYFRTPV